MRKALPVVTEDADALTQDLQRTDDGRKTPRLQLPYLPASAQAHTRQEVAQLLGVHPTIGHWLAIDESKSLDALLDLYAPAGKPHQRRASVVPLLMLGSRPRRDRGQGGRGMVTRNARLQRHPPALELGVACAELGGRVVRQLQGQLQNT
jgi:hypothetical protein